VGRFAVTAFQQRSSQVRHAGHVLEACRHAAHPIIISSDADVVNAGDLHDMLDVRHQIIERGGRNMPTGRVHRQTPILSAVIARLLIVIVSGHHATIAFSANNQSRKQSRAPLRNAHRVVKSAILFEAFLIRQISIPGDVSG